MLLILAAPAQAQTVEEIFAAARNYTVFIETRIETPFIEDDPGSYLGAGFIVDRERGWVMTNAHVVGRSPATLNVSFADGSTSTATPLYIDSFLDLAIVQLEDGVTRARSEASLDCAHRPDIGVPVGAYGHPNGYRFTGTRGIVSGFSMRAGSSGLQTDAPINAGNSGGPLIRLDTGSVVGINTQSLVGKDVQKAPNALPLPQRGHFVGPVIRRRGASQVQLLQRTCIPRISNPISFSLGEMRGSSIE